jgi:hypothetical protein
MALVGAALRAVQARHLNVLDPISFRPLSRLWIARVHDPGRHASLEGVNLDFRRTRPKCQPDRLATHLDLRVALLLHLMNHPRTALPFFVGYAAVTIVRLVLKLKPRGVATLERHRDEQAEDFLEQLEQGEQAIPDYDRGNRRSRALRQ